MESYDVVVIGSGPSGQKAAIQGAKLGQRVLVIEQDVRVGGACVHYGTIPSKTLRESASELSRLRRSADLLATELRPGTEVASLMTRLDQVVGAHVGYIGRQMDRNGVELLHGRARFVDARTLAVSRFRGGEVRFSADVIVIATGSRPRNPPEIAIDHENILDSDSILSMLYLPASLTVLGGGVIASEYASIFAALGVKVTMIDKADRPLKFMDAELTAKFVEAFGHAGGTYLGEQTIAGARFDGVTQVVTTLASGAVVTSDKMLVALGRAANLDGLDLAAAGLAATPRGLLQVDEHCRTAAPGIYAVGDVIGPPSLAATAMEQGRRAVCHALGLPPGQTSDLIPIGIYTIPEMASIGLGEDEATRRFGGCVAGRARFDEVARGQISGITDGLLKLIADPSGHKVLGVHIVGEGATELVHVGQMAMLGALPVDGFVENIFNFPTLAEAYRVAALDIARRRPH